MPGSPPDTHPAARIFFLQPEASSHSHAATYSAAQLPHFAISPAAHSPFQLFCPFFSLPPKYVTNRSVCRTAKRPCRTITAPHGSSVFTQTWQPRRQYYDTSPVTGSTFSALSSSSPISSSVRWPASARIFRSISSANAGLSRRTCLAFSRPCPSLSPL